jgi:hypothetical protein
MKAICAALCALSCSGLAHASPVCEYYRGLMPSAPEGYPELRGEQIHAQTWRSTSKVADAADCFIGVNSDQTLHGCRWAYLAEEEVTRAYDRSLDDARTCFQDWSELPRVNWDDEPSPEAPGRRFVGPGGYTYGVAIIPQDTPLGRVHWLSLGLLWRPPPSVS